MENNSKSKITPSIIMLGLALFGVGLIIWFYQVIQPLDTDSTIEPKDLKIKTDLYENIKKNEEVKQTEKTADQSYGRENPFKNYK